ncbi:DUF3662 and FHA domain-containing protein [Corynebacterium uterequi]|uniref:FHA domain-containing protein n=1 Tax=Corynebacterium uterequi TaxID=1072256 RepID=A0A0G3HBJ8_9CORY|nr:DUF3662 and FHA domain-containing protein [Corynebacterium uterequi]AKK10075.1 FHA domain-containing protein [Corynebacterium uterequi]
MSFMDRFARLDSSLQRGLDNSFALVFGGKVVPAEIEELLKQEAEDNLVTMDDGRTFAPATYLVGVSTRDLENLAKDQYLPAGMADRLNRFGRNKGWEYAGHPVVRIAEESGLRTGQLRVTSKTWSDPTMRSGFESIHHGDSSPKAAPENPAPAPEPAPAPAPAPEPVAPPAPVVPPVVPPIPEPVVPPVVPPAAPTVRDAYHYPAADSARTTRFTAADAVEPEEPAKPERVVSLLLQDGSSRTFHLKEGSNIIGRSNETDFRLPDTGVSRQHAEITWDGVDAVLADLQSTNGTQVNDTPIDNWLLADGDVITMGHSHIEVRINSRHGNR